MIRKLLLLPAFTTALILQSCMRGETEPEASADSGSIRDHVTFYGTGKVARYKQHMDASLENMGPLFFAGIFITADGAVTEASVRFPPPVGDVRRLDYRHSESEEIGDVMYVSGMAESDEALEPGQTYSMYVEHALLPHTQEDYGMPAFATFAASTYMDFITLGDTDPAYCEEATQ